MRKLLWWQVVAVPALALGALDSNQWRFARNVEGDAPVRIEMSAVLLDEAVHGAAAERYDDLRILDESGREVPYCLEKEARSETNTVRRTVASRARSVKELPGNRLEAEFELEDATARADGFTVETPLRDFVRSVSVQGRADGGAWQVLVQGGDLFDYSRYLDVRRTEVALPPGSGPQFRVEIGNATEERIQPYVKLVSQQGGRDAGAEIRTRDLLTTPFRMDRLAFWRHETVVEKGCEVRRAWPLPAPAVVENTREKATEFTVPTGRIPLNRLVLTTTSRNFSRAARVQVEEVENGVPRWRDVATARVVDVDLPGLARTEMALSFPERRAERLRVVVENGDNPPLNDVKFTGFGPVLQLVWLAEPARAYRLLYGGANHAAPIYDLDAVLKPARQRLNPVARSLGAPRENAAYRPAHAGLAAWLNSPMFLTGAILCAALVLVALLAGSLKRVSGALDGKDAKDDPAGS